MDYINERNPHCGKCVLVWAEKIIGEIYHERNEPSYAIVEFESAKSSPLVDWDYYQMNATGITHWMPLPEPPKTEE